MSLLMGLAAALVWGVHDLVIRVLRPTGDALALLLVAFAAGTVLLAPVALLLDGRLLPAAPALPRAALAGLAYAAGGLGLYRAFGIGPVRLVAPLCGSYPVLSLAFAAAEGRAVPWADWLAVAALVAGLALAASRAPDEAGGEEGGGPRLAAILWALLGAAGFALTFWLAQGAAEAGGEVAATVALRLAAMATVALALLATRSSPAPALAHWRALLLVGALDATAVTLVVAAAGAARPELAAVASSAFGLVTILLAWRVLREPMAPVQWAGAVLCFAAIAAVAA